MSVYYSYRENPLHMETLSLVKGSLQREVRLLETKLARLYQINEKRGINHQALQEIEEMQEEIAALQSRIHNIDLQLQRYA